MRIEVRTVYDKSDFSVGRDTDRLWALINATIAADTLRIAGK